MTVIAFIGKPRTGKTLHMTFLGYENYKRGNKIFTNYKTTFGTKLEINELLQIPFQDIDRNPKTLMIQEADKWFDSRSPMKVENKLLNNLTGQAGKRNLDIYLDTQFWNRLDNAIRYVVDTIITASAFVDKFKNPLAFHYTSIDVWDYQNDPNYTPKEYTLTIHQMQPYFKLYDSFEPTKGLTKKQKIEEILGIENE